MEPPAKKAGGSTKKKKNKTKQHKGVSSAEKIFGFSRGKMQTSSIFMLQIVNFSRKNIKMCIKVVGYCGHYRLSVVCVSEGMYVALASTNQHVSEGMYVALALARISTYRKVCM